MNRRTTPEKLRILMAILAAALFLPGCYSSRRLPPFLEGIYQSERVDDYWIYLRFYSDGTVLTVSSTGTPEEVASWFNKSREGLSQGTYRIKGDSLFFRSADDYGTVVYRGVVRNRAIRLESLSLINGHRAVRVYRQVIPGT